MGRTHIAIIKLATLFLKNLTLFTAGRSKTVQQKVINKILANDQFKTTLLLNLGVLFHFAFMKIFEFVYEKVEIWHMSTFPLLPQYKKSYFFCASGGFQILCFGLHTKTIYK